MALPTALNPVNEVFVEGSPGIPLGGNLLITAEPLDGQRIDVEGSKNSIGGLRTLETPLEPGEIQMQAIHLISLMELEKMELQLDSNTIENKLVHWEALSDPGSKGRWNLRLSWRPDEQFPIPEDMKLKIERGQVNVPQEWRDVQIDLPALEWESTPSVEGNQQ